MKFWTIICLYASKYVMLTFWEWAGGPVVGSHYNDAIMQNSGLKSKYGAVEARPLGEVPVSDCKFLGINCAKKDRYRKDNKKRRNRG